MYICIFVRIQQILAHYPCLCVTHKSASTCTELECATIMANGRMRWLRLVGSLKSQVSFAEYRLCYRALLQKRPIILRSLLIVATPYRPPRACAADE